MGSELGVYDDEEIAGLSDAQKEELRKDIIEKLKATGILKQLLITNPQFRDSLRDSLRAQHASKLKLKG